MNELTTRFNFLLLVPVQVPVLKCFWCRCRCCYACEVLYCPQNVVSKILNHNTAPMDPNLPLPDDSLYHVLSYLTPCDLRAFSKILPHASQLHLNCNSNTKLMKATLSNSLNQLLKGSEVEFKCSSPLKSFVELTNKVPPGTVCIRSVLIMILLCVFHTMPRTDKITLLVEILVFRQS